MKQKNLYSETIFCPLEKCEEWRKHWGPTQSTVGDKFPPYSFDGIAKCKKCGGIWDGKQWIHRCVICLQDVEPGSLVGIFVPHACRPCKQKEREDQIQKKQVCSICHRPYVDCYC